MNERYDPIKLGSDFVYRITCRWCNGINEVEALRARNQLCNCNSRAPDCDLPAQFMVITLDYPYTVDFNGKLTKVKNYL